MNTTRSATWNVKQMERTRCGSGKKPTAPILQHSLDYQCCFTGGERLRNRWYTSFSQYITCVYYLTLEEFRLAWHFSYCTRTYWSPTPHENLGAEHQRIERSLPCNDQYSTYIVSPYYSHVPTKRHSWRFYETTCDAYASLVTLKTSQYNVNYNCTIHNNAFPTCVTPTIGWGVSAILPLILSHCKISSYHHVFSE